MKALAAGKDMKPPSGGHGAGGDPASCPFAAMFGMPAQPKKPKPPSILQKWIEKTEAEIAEEGEDQEGEGGGCPFAQAFGVSSGPSELEKKHQEMLEKADQPGSGQFIWKRKVSLESVALRLVHHRSPAGTFFCARLCPPLQPPFSLSVSLGPRATS